MDRKKVYLVQINVTYSNTIAYLPYAAGCLAAYAWNDNDIKQSYELAEILCVRHKLDESFNKIQDPAVIGFSCYVWNMEYNLRLAKLVKEKYPDCTVVFGGHNVPDDVSLLEKHPFIDVLMHSEGEEPFALLLKALDGKGSLEDIPDISFRNGEKLVTTQKKRLYDITNYPSPYTAKVFEPFLKNIPISLFTQLLKQTEVARTDAPFAIGASQRR